MRTRRFAYLFPLSVAAVAGVGCASTRGPVPYPASWPPLENAQVANGCPAISGTYVNQASGTWPSEGSRIPTLTEVFSRMARGPGLMNPSRTGHAWAVPSDAESSTFQLEAERLAVTFTGTGGATGSVTFRRYRFDLAEKRFDDLFICYEGPDTPRLRFLAEPESHTTSAAPLYVEGGGTLVFLHKATDGSLIVQWRSDSLAVSAVVLGTRMKFESVWWRFAPVDRKP
jgi:hypothetical protein